MIRLSLKNIIGKKSDSFPFIVSFIQQVNAMVYVEDENGKFLLGNEQADTPFQEPVTFDDTIYGWVKGDEKVAVVAGVLSHLLLKEAERMQSQARGSPNPTIFDSPPCMPQALQ